MYQGLNAQEIFTFLYTLPRFYKGIYHHLFERLSNENIELNIYNVTINPFSNFITCVFWKAAEHAKGELYSDFISAFMQLKSKGNFMHKISQYIYFRWNNNRAAHSNIICTDAPTYTHTQPLRCSFLSQM